MCCDLTPGYLASVLYCFTLLCIHIKHRNITELDRELLEERLELHFAAYPAIHTY